MANRPKSIKKALELGIVIRWDTRVDYNYRDVYQIYVKYFTPIPSGHGWSRKGEWFECYERYFSSFVMKHRNFKA